MIQFSYHRISDHSFEIRIQTPMTRVGTLHRLITAIYVLGLDVISATVETILIDDAEYSRDTFGLQFGENCPNGDINLMSTQLGLLMETVIQDQQDPAELLKEYHLQPPEVMSFFDTPPVILFQDHPETSTTQFHIEAVNRRGLLYHLTRVLFEEGVNIRRGVVGQKDGYIEDTFYLQFRDGILGEEFSAKIEKSILGRSN